MTHEQLERRVRFLTLYAVGSTLSILVVLLVAFRSDAGSAPNSVERVDTLRATYVAAERIDVVEPDDILAISLSNSERTPLPTFEGRTLRAAGDRPAPSIIFFDGHGDEVGGMVFSNETTADGYRASRHFSMDGYGQDQVVYLSHYDRNGSSETGLHVVDRPDTSIVAAMDVSGIDPDDDRETLARKLDSLRSTDPERLRALWGSPKRLFLGATREDASQLELRDPQGRPRLRLSVDSTGTPRVEVLDADGTVTDRFPPQN